MIPVHTMCKTHIFWSRWRMLLKTEEHNNANTPEKKKDDHIAPIGNESINILTTAESFDQGVNDDCTIPKVARFLCVFIVWLGLKF